MFYGVTFASLVAYFLQIALGELLGEMWMFEILGMLTLMSFCAFWGFTEKKISIVEDMELRLLQSSN